MIQIYLSELLAERQMTQAELSRLCGIRPSTISMIYNGLADRLNVHHLDKICGALDCNLSDLLVAMYFLYSGSLAQNVPKSCSKLRPVPPSRCMIFSRPYSGKEADSSVSK